MNSFYATQTHFVPTALPNIITKQTRLQTTLKKIKQNLLQVFTIFVVFAM
jgi:hypothetical protein